MRWGGEADLQHSSRSDRLRAKTHEFKKPCSGNIVPCRNARYQPVGAQGVFQPPSAEPAAAAGDSRTLHGGCGGGCGGGSGRTALALGDELIDPVDERKYCDGDLPRPAAPLLSEGGFTANPN